MAFIIPVICIYSFFSSILAETFVVRPDRVPKQAYLADPDCGIFCLTAIVRSMGREIRFAELKRSASQDRRGTSVATLVELAKSQGVDALPVKVSLNLLKKAGARYAILLVSLPSRKAPEYSHYVALFEVDSPRNLCLLLDSRRGFKWKHISDIKKIFTGYAILFDEPRAGLNSLDSRITMLFRSQSMQRKLISFILVGTAVLISVGLLWYWRRKKGAQLAAKR